MQNLLCCLHSTVFMSVRLFMKYFAQNVLSKIAYIPMLWVKDLKTDRNSNCSLQFLDCRPDDLMVFSTKQKILNI